MLEIGSGGRRARRLALAALGTALFWVLLWLVSLDFQAAKASEHGTYPHDWGALPAIAGQSSASHIDSRLSGVATELAGRAAEVRCWSAGDWDRLGDEIAARWSYAERPGLTGGYTSLDRNRVNLSPMVCRELGHILYGGIDFAEDDWDDLSWAVNMLSHESMHVRGLDDESVAECYGVQAIPRAARLLGLSKGVGRHLADRYWARWYLHQEDPEYRAYECRDGGKLDRTPRDDVWP